MKDLTADEAKDCVNLCECGAKPKLIDNGFGVWYQYRCPICGIAGRLQNTISGAVIEWNKENKKK